MRFKVGDKVKIRKDLKSNNKYGNVWFDEHMLQYKGKDAIIQDIFYGDTYILSVDNHSNVWSDEMLCD